MIQRIQTLFLLAIVVLSGLMFSGDILLMDTGTGTMFNIRFPGLEETGVGIIQRLWPLTAIIALVPLLAMASIFSYKKRALQMRITMFVLLLSLGTLILGAFYVLTFDRKIDVTVIWKVKAVLPLVSAILAWLAYRAIMMDDLRVRSYDRLR